MILKTLVSVTNRQSQARASHHNNGTLLMVSDNDGLNYKEYENMDVMFYTQIASHIMICVTGGVAIWQLLAIRKNSKADHERRRKQATIEFHHKISSKCYELLSQINCKFQEDMVINVCDVKDDDATIKVIKKYLALMEMLAVGINTGIYDIAMFDRMNGAFVIRCYNRFKEIIAFLRRDIYAYRYSDFESLVSKLTEVQNKRFPRHDKDFAKMKYDLC